jgi:hypothetical protein
MSTPRPPSPRYALHSDEDGELFLHSDDAASASWNVVVVGEHVGDASCRETPSRLDRGIAFPALNWRVPMSAWYVGRDHCHLELLDEKGDRHMLGNCPHTVEH